MGSQCGREPLERFGRRGRQPQHPFAEPAHAVEDVIEGLLVGQQFVQLFEVLLLQLLGRHPRHDQSDMGGYSGAGLGVVHGSPVADKRLRFGHGHEHGALRVLVGTAGQALVGLLPRRPQFTKAL